MRFSLWSNPLNRRRIVRFAIVLIAVGILSAERRMARADEPTADALQAQLAAGEFGPALRDAGALGDPRLRDKWLGQIAAAQAKAGANSASLNTAAGINDDQARATALNDAGTAAGGRGGNQPQFDQLIELITTTIAPTTWDEVGGPGAIHEFRGGVYVDAQGVLRRTLHEEKNTGLAAERLKALEAAENGDIRATSALRKVSLTRLERQVQLRLAAGRRPTEEMLAMAGLEKIKYVMVYPETGDLVLAGPAGEWQPDADGRLVSQSSGRPVLQLDDVVVILRHMMRPGDAKFGCSINPREEALARTKEFLEESSKSPLKEGTRDRWLKQIRDRMGLQDVVVDGVDPQTRVAQVLVEADYRMKLVGMGIEPGVVGVKSYLDLIQVPKGQAPPPLDVLRWWFTLNYDDVRATEQHDAFELRGQGVQVLSENEMLTAIGKRVHTGKSEPLNQEFAQSFTQHFAALASKYPVYADLQNIFDLALVGALIKSEDLTNRLGWHLTCFGNPKAYPVSFNPAPKTVETVMHHRVINQKHIVAGVSGGVRVDPWSLVSPQAVQIDKQGKLATEHGYGTPKPLPPSAWWWD
jgi:hypothetical protein